MPFLSKKHAQSIVEYTMIIILVASGIVLTGGYVIRSVNAQFKSWEDSVDDSINDPMTQIPLADLGPLPTPSCFCPPTYRDVDCGERDCLPTQMAKIKECVPQGCDPDFVEDSICVDDSRCYECIGTIPDNAGECDGYGEGLSGSWDITLVDTCPGGENHCDVVCGSGFERAGQTCVAITYACNGTMPENSQICTGYEVALTQDRNVTLVATCPGGSDHCDVECKAGYEKEEGVCVEIPGPCAEIDCKTKGAGSCCSILGSDGETECCTELWDSIGRMCPYCWAQTECDFIGRPWTFTPNGLCESEGVYRCVCKE